MTLLAAADLGSTFTKIVVFDAGSGEVVAFNEVPTDRSDLGACLDAALLAVGVRPDRLRLASSAGGGLRVVGVGYVESLTAWAAAETVLGSGARLVRTTAGRLTRGDVDAIAVDRPDIVLLTGGTDGGDREVLIANAKALASLDLNLPVVLAGNREAVDDAREYLGERHVAVADNVLPTVNRLNVDGARAALHHVFNERVIVGKGLEAVARRSEVEVVPTPTAVMRGAECLAERRGGVTIAVDVGGATVDVHSIGSCSPPEEGLVVSLPLPPDAKRTVEADLGLREGADVLASLLEGRIPGTDEAVAAIHGDFHWLPATVEAARAEAALAQVSIRTALRRHCGRLREELSPAGRVWRLVGKDLRSPSAVVAVGGIFRHGAEAGRALDSLFDESDPACLTPRRGRLFLDRRHGLFAAGLWRTELLPGALDGLLAASLVELPASHAG